MKIALVAVSIIFLIILVIAAMFALLFSLGLIYSVLRNILYPLFLIFRWIRNSFNRQVKDFRAGFKKKINKRVYKKTLLKDWKAEMRSRRKEYAPPIIRICKNFARAMKLWYKKEYLRDNTVLDIGMGRFGKFAISVVVSFNEEKPSIVINGGGTTEILLDDFSEEKLVAALKERRMYLI